MIDYYLRASSEDVMHAALAPLGEDVTIDLVGVLYRVLDDGETCEVLPGFHANTRSAQPIEWPETVEVLDLETPMRVFA